MTQKAGSPYRLIGAADPGDKGQGFLIPIFMHASSNAPLVQRIDRDGEVVGYDAVSADDLPIVALPTAYGDVGEPAYWAFGFNKGDILVGRGEDNQDRLLQLFEQRQEFFLTHPFIAIEVAEFLNRNDQALFASSAFRWLENRNPRSAERWRDLSVLTPKLRSALAVELRDDEARDLINRISARVANGAVQIRGLSRKDEQTVAPALHRVVKRVMSDLASVYPRGNDWAVRVVRSAEPFDSRNMRDLSTLRALVWFADLDSRSDSPLVRESIGIYYGKNERAQFEYQSSEFEGPSFVVFQLDSTEDTVWSTRWRSPSKLSFGLAQRTSSAQQLTSREFAALDRCSLPTAVLPSRTSSPFNRQPLSAEIRDCIDILSSNDLLLSERSVFLRASGSTPDRSADAWAQIFDRASSLAIERESGVALETDGGSGREMRSVLFPSLDVRPFISPNASIDAAAFIELGDRAQYEAESDRVQLFENIFRRTGWRVEGSGQPFEQTIRISGEIAKFDVRQDLPRDVRGRYDFSHLMEVDLLGDVSQLVVSNRATTGNVLTALSVGDLRVSVRDVASFGSEANIWGLLGLQMRRFVNSLPSRTRTHYFALLCQAAVQRDRIDVADGDWFVRTINSADCGEQWHFTSSRYHCEDGRYSIRLRSPLSPYGSNADRPSEEYLLHLTSQGPSVMGMPS